MSSCKQTPCVLHKFGDPLTHRTPMVAAMDGNRGPPPGVTIERNEPKSPLSKSNCRKRPLLLFRGLRLLDGCLNCKYVFEPAVSAYNICIHVYEIFDLLMHLFSCLCVCVSSFIYIYIYIHICMCIYIHIYMHACMHASQRDATHA